MLHWFPGHMHKARKELIKIIPQVDIVFEVVDARAPEASANPVLQEIAQDKPIIKILNKSDLSTPDVTQQWLKFYKNKAIALNIPSEKKLPEKLLILAEKFVPNRGTTLKPIRAVIIGIPNVGKSTLMNKLAGKKIAKTGNEPAITKQQQNILITRKFYLRDTPGIMTPSPKCEDSAYRLAILGAIRDTAMDYPSAAYYLLRYLIIDHSSYLCERFNLIKDDLLKPESILLEKIAIKIGAIKNDAEINLHQASEKLILDFRSGRMGKISLETPAVYLAEKENQKTEPSE